MPTTHHPPVPRTTETIARETLAHLFDQVEALIHGKNDGNAEPWQEAENKLREALQVVHVVQSAIQARGLQPASAGQGDAQ